MNTLLGILLISLFVSHFLFLILAGRMINKLVKEAPLDDGIKRIYRKKIRYAVSKMDQLNKEEQRRVRKIVLFDRIALGHILVMAVVVILWNAFS